MKTLPSLIFLANRGRLLAYRSTPADHLEPIDSLQPVEGNRKISEVVTDQSGSFPAVGPAMASHESLPLLDEMKIRADRQIAAKMMEILEREQPFSWAFSAPSEINAALLERLPSELKGHLVRNLKLDLTNLPPAEVASRLLAEARAAVR